MPEWVALVVGVLVALASGSGTAWFLLRSQRGKLNADSGKTRAEAADVLTGAALEIVRRQESRVEKLEARVEELEERVAVLERENRQLLYGTTKLTAQLLDLGHKPMWQFREIGGMPEPES